MAESRIYKRTGYVPFTEDPNVRKRIMKSLDRQRWIPERISDAYPDRGDQIHTKIQCYVQANGPNEIWTEPSPLTALEKIEDTLCVLCVFGNDSRRIAAQKQALDLLRSMNPLPHMVIVEGCTDGKWYFDYVKNIDGFDYIPIDLTYPQFRNLFIKECLWNIGAHAEMEANKKFKYLVFLDADTFFVDRYGWRDIRDSFDKYNIISPYMKCYYTGEQREAKQYQLLSSIGYNVRRNVNRAGYQGFGIGISVEAYNYYFNSEFANPSLGMGDVLMWYMLTGNNQMKGFKLLPYNEEECKKFILHDGICIGSSNQILGHIDHGPIDNRSYAARVQLMKMAVPVPLSELARVKGTNYLVSWADNPQAVDLRTCFERMLIENRRELKICTANDTEEFYRWIHGDLERPPACMLPNRYTQNYNKLPNQDHSINVSDSISTI